MFPVEFDSPPPPRPAISKKYKQHWESCPGTKKDAEKRHSEILHAIDNGIIIAERGKEVVEKH